MKFYFEQIHESLVKSKNYKILTDELYLFKQHMRNI